MILGIGIDLVEIARLEAALTQHGTRFRDRIFTPQEIEYCELHARAIHHYAGRFAAKEAGFKALGTGWSQGLSWHDIEIFPAATSPPSLHLHRLASDLFSQRGGRFIHLSISHTDHYAVAQVIFES